MNKLRIVKNEETFFVKIVEDTMFPYINIYKLRKLGNFKYIKKLDTLNIFKINIYAERDHKIFNKNEENYLVELAEYGLDLYLRLHQIEMMNKLKKDQQERYFNEKCKSLHCMRNV